VSETKRLEYRARIESKGFRYERTDYTFTDERARDEWVKDTAIDYKPVNVTVTVRKKHKPRTLSWAVRQVEKGRTVTCLDGSHTYISLACFEGRSREVLEATDWRVVE